MRKSTTSLTPDQVYRYAVACCQPHLKLRDIRNVTASMLLTILFAAAARISSISDTCKRLRRVPDEEVVAAALYETLPGYSTLKRQVNAARAGHLPKPLRKRPQIVAFDLTLLPYYGADAKDNDQLYRSKAKRGTWSFYAYASAYIVPKGQRYTVALMAVTRKQTMEDVTKELLRQVRKAGIHVRFRVLDRECYSVAVIRYLQAARTPFLMPVVGHGRKPDHPLGPSGSPVCKAMKRSGWFEYPLSDPRKRTATVQICVKCRNRRGERGKQGREPWIYAYRGIGPKRFARVEDTYRSRFGIETSYRQMNQCRIRTPPPRFAVRFLYVAIAMLLRNRWVWLQYAVLSSPHRGCRWYHLDRLPLRTMLLGLQGVAFAMYERVEIALCERQVPERITC